jgi:hypothetical protein
MEATVCRKYNENPRFLMLQNCPPSENGSIRLPKVQIGSICLPKAHISFTSLAPPPAYRWSMQTKQYADKTLTFGAGSYILPLLDLFILR